MDPPMLNVRRRRFQRRRSFWLDKKHQQLYQFLDEKSSHLRRPNLQICSKSHEELTLPDDLMFKIFILLPAESIWKSQFVCKKWFELINSSFFIEFHKQQSETVLISQIQFLEELIPPLPGSSRAKPHFHFLDVDHGQENFVESSLVNSVNIRASYDGLILGVTDNEKSLILMNPVTRKHTKVPLGTIGFQDCYGLVFCSKERTYKVVHLFREPSGYTVCEILSVNTRKWVIIDGPSSNLLEDIELIPVSVGGSLYWMPRRHGCDYFLSLSVEDKEFISKKLPIVCTLSDRLVELGGVLGFVTHAALHLMQVWTLVKRTGEGVEFWVKRYSVYLQFDARNVVPICSSRDGRGMVFEYPGNNLYFYSFETDDMKKIYSRDDEEMQDRIAAEQLFIPHRNTLVHWNV